jgi:hypothetical protein
MSAARTGHIDGVTVRSLEELQRLGPEDPDIVDLVLPEIGGGKAVAADFEAIEGKPKATTLRVSGLDQETFEQLVEQHGSRFSAIHFWKCPRVADLSPLENLSGLTHVAYFWNQRAARLWNLNRTPALRGLKVEDFNKLQTLDDLAAAQSLEELEVGDGIWVKNSVDSLDPLAGLSRLRRLTFTYRKVLDGRVSAVGQLQDLEYLQCPTNIFTSEQFAWLRARLPVAQGRVLSPVIRFDAPLAGDDDPFPKDVLVVGKRKPFLNSTKDADRIRRYEAEFERMVQRFKSDPTAEPEPAS